MSEMEIVNHQRREPSPQSKIVYMWGIGGCNEMARRYAHYLKQKLGTFHQVSILKPLCLTV